MLGGANAEERLPAPGADAVAKAPITRAGTPYGSEKFGIVPAASVFGVIVDGCGMAVPMSIPPSPDQGLPLVRMFCVTSRGSGE
jgi:hypothetical protein